MSLSTMLYTHHTPAPPQHGHATTPQPFPHPTTNLPTLHPTNCQVIYKTRMTVSSK